MSISHSSRLDRIIETIYFKTKFTSLHKISGLYYNLNLMALISIIKILSWMVENIKFVKREIYVDVPFIA